MLASLLLLLVASSCDKLVTPPTSDTAINILGAGVAAGEASLQVGGNLQLSVQGAIGEVVWSSSDRSVATVLFTGWVTAIRGGTATITAENQGRTASVSVTVIDEPPVADAGPDVTAAVGVNVTLDGSGSSDPESQALTYVWSLESQPAGSTAALSGADTATPSLTPDVAGDYVVELIVNDGGQDSQPDDVTVTAVTPMVVCQLTPSSLDHGTEQTWPPLGSSDRTFTIANVGSLTAQGNVRESCAAYSIQAGDGIFTLPGGQTRTVTVRFAPDSNTPGQQNCSIRTGIPECPSVPATGIGMVSFANQILPEIQSCDGSCHVGSYHAVDYNWAVSYSSPGNPANSELLTHQHVWGPPGFDSRQTALIIAWIIQGRPNN